MKFTLSWLKDHLETHASAAEVVDAMTMAGLEVEDVSDPAAKLKAFTVAKITQAVQHPNADRLRVCQVDTVDGMKEIVCGAPNARAGLTTVYAPIGAYVPGLGVTLVEKPVRGVVSNGMLCSAAELEQTSDIDGILELPDSLAVGTPAAEAFGAEAVIDFEVTPNRPDWLGVAGIARDLAAAGVGRLKDLSVKPVQGAYPCPIRIDIKAPDACPMFAGRVIRGVKNGPSPAWLQARLKAIGLRPINALVDVTNLVSYDRNTVRLDDGSAPLDLESNCRNEARRLTVREKTEPRARGGCTGVIRRICFKDRRPRITAVIPFPNEWQWPAQSGKKMLELDQRHLTHHH